MFWACFQTGAAPEHDRHAMLEISLPSFPFTPQLGWSTTRSETFRTCRRRYFYQYLASSTRDPAGADPAAQGIEQYPDDRGHRRP